MEVAGRVRLEDGGEELSPRPVPALASATSRSESWQWLGLAAALVLTTLGVYALAQPTDTAQPATNMSADGNALEAPTVETVAETMGRAEAEWNLAIAQLEQVIKNDDGAAPADPEMLASLGESLTVIDSAIAESRTALSESPGSRPARTSLFDALRNKVNVLQHTVVLMNEMRKGDAAGAAEAIGIKKTS